MSLKDSEQKVTIRDGIYVPPDPESEEVLEQLSDSMRKWLGRIMVCSDEKGRIGTENTVSSMSDKYGVAEPTVHSVIAQFESMGILDRMNQAGSWVLNGKSPEPVNRSGPDNTETKTNGNETEPEPSDENDEKKKTVYRRPPASFGAVGDRRRPMPVEVEIEADGDEELPSKNEENDVYDRDDEIPASKLGPEMILEKFNEAVPEDFRAKVLTKKRRGLAKQLISTDWFPKIAESVFEGLSECDFFFRESSPVNFTWFLECDEEIMVRIAEGEFRDFGNDDSGEKNDEEQVNREMEETKKYLDEKSARKESGESDDEKDDREKKVEKDNGSSHDFGTGNFVGDDGKSGEDETEVDHSDQNELFDEEEDDQDQKGSDSIWK